MRWSESQKVKGIKLALTWWRDRWKKKQVIDGREKVHYFPFPNSASGYEQALMAWAKLNGQDRIAQQAAHVRQLIAVAEPGELENAPAALAKLEAGIELDRTERPLYGVSQAGRAIWQNRIKKAVNPPASVQTVATEIQKFLNDKRKQVSGGNRAAVTWRDLDGALRVFENWISPTYPIKKIGPATVKDYYHFLLEKKREPNTNQKKGTPVSEKPLTANRRYNLFRLWKQWLRWLWMQEDTQLPALPKNINNPEFTFAVVEDVEPAVNQIWKPEEIATLLANKSNKWKAMILLCLNCGFTNADLDILKKAQIHDGRLIHRRAKTRKLTSPPVVNYKLWQCTIDALNALPDNGSKLVFLTEDGTRLICSAIVEVNGIVKHRKYDTITRAWNRMLHSTVAKNKVTKPFKFFRKTSATILKRDNRYAWLRDVFLGETAKQVSDKHYAFIEGGAFAPLDEATEYLRAELKL